MRSVRVMWTRGSSSIWPTSTGAVIGRDFDGVGKEAIPFLGRFRKELIVLHEDVGRAGHFLAKAIIAAIDAAMPTQTVETLGWM